LAIWEGSVYPKGRKWWLRHKRLGSEDWTNSPSPYYQGVEGDREKAEALLLALREKWQAHHRAAGPGGGPLTVQAWGDRWLAKRRAAGIDAVRHEEFRLRLHVYPVIGDVPLVDVRRSHVRALMEAVKEKPRAARSAKELEHRERLAPRTVLHVYRTGRQLFRAAVRAELLESSPWDLERDELPKKEDKDPTWRADAVFTAAEVEALISDPRIPEDRRVLYAIEFLTGSRSGEAAAVRWGRWDRALKPLGRLALLRSYNSRAREERLTKTKRPRLVPVHPALAQVLAAWKLAGWERFQGRRPTDEDLVVPSPTGAHRHVGWSLQKFHADLAALGLRKRRHYDSRRTFRSIAGDAGAYKETVRWITHTPGDQIDDYHSPSWESLCSAVSCIPVRVRAARGSVARLR
jgi:hypothetical protein